MIRTIAAALALLVSASVFAQSPAPAPVQPVKRPDKTIDPASCVTAECHSSVKATPVVHGPVATNACFSCHEQTSIEKHTFKVTRQNAELCTYCHEFSVADMPAIHKPVADGQCLGCHDPHGGVNQSITREKNTFDLCSRCHENVKMDKKFLHAPVAQGACDSCHTPHAAKFPKLLDVVGADMCLSCHVEFEPAIAGAKSHHKAMEKGCTECHNAHGSNAPMSLAKPVPELCMGCHEKLKDKVASATVQHSAISRDRACMTCHAAHASNVGKLLTEPQAEGCIKCHDKAIKTQRGYTVASVKEVMDPKLVKHGEIKDGQCAGCHEVHGGERAMLLTQPYSRVFYQNFSVDHYALCFSCHDSQLVMAERTTKVTGFRNGDVNLHSVHAKSGTRDKNCRACHTMHAGPSERLIRETMTYGKWQMPMRFNKTATGGSCFPGCHGQYAYDREKPVPATRPTTNPAQIAATLPRSAHEEAHVISWSATDTNGKAVSIPASKQATALVLVASEDKGSAALLTRLYQASAGAKDVQTIVVCSGRGADQEAAELAKTTRWPVVADTNREAVEALGVHGWPMVLVLQPDGLEIARISGDATFLAIKLPAYLERAAGRIDEKTMQQRLAARPVVEADPGKRIARDLRVARVLLDENRPQQAIAFLDRDAKMLANTPESKALRAEALIQLKKADDALNVLDQIPANDVVRPGQMDLLRAQAFMVQERWDLAKPLLESALNKSPDLAQAHRLLGQIFELEQNWAKAAEHYRAASEAGLKSR